MQNLSVCSFPAVTTLLPPKPTVRASGPIARNPWEETPWYTTSVTAAAPRPFLPGCWENPWTVCIFTKNDDACRRREQEYGFSVRSFYDYTPAITGVARELLFSQYAPSCTGYALQGKKAVPRFEEPAWDYAESYLLSEIQESALDFVRDFCGFFGKDWEGMEMRNMDVSYPYEYFLHTLTETDAHLFDCCIFEDHLWAGQTFVLSRQWQEDIRYHRLLPFYRAADRDSLRPVEKVVTLR